MNTVRLLRVLAVLTVLGFVAFLTTACNTMEGIGEDVSAAGQSMADVAADTNPQKK